VNLVDDFRWFPCRSPGVNSGVTVSTDHQGLAFQRSHLENPGWSFPLSLDLEVREFPYMVDLNPVPRATEFACVRQKTSDKLGSGRRRAVQVRWDVHETEERIGRKSDSSEPCDQRFLAWSVKSHLHAPHGPSPMIDLGLEASGCLGDGRSVDMSKGLEHGCLHDPLQMVKPVSILGKGIVLSHASEFASVCLDDEKVTRVPKFGTVNGFPSSHILGDFGLQLLGWHSERNLSRRRLPETRAVIHSNVISEEPGLFGPGMSDQGLFRGHFQFELISQELFQLDLDLFGLILRAGETQEEVVGISDVPKPSIVGIILVTVSDPSGLDLEGFQGILFRPTFSELLDFGDEPDVILVPTPDISLGILRNEGLFDEFIEPVQVDVREQWANDTALRCPAQGGSVAPLSRYPALSRFSTRIRKRLSWIFSRRIVSRTVWSMLSKHPLISPSMNHREPVQAWKMSFRAVWQPRSGRKPWDVGLNCGS